MRQRSEKQELVLGSRCFKVLQRLAVAFVLSSSALTAFAAEVSIAGFAFSGDAESIPQRFPYTAELIARQGDNAGSFHSLVLERGQSVKNPSYHFTPGTFVNLKNDSALMSVLMLTGETVDTENYGAYYKTFVNLRGNALIFDYKSQAVVLSCPVNVVLFDATPQQPTHQRISDFVDDLVRRGDAKGLVTQFAKCLDKAPPQHEGIHTVQVRHSAISPEALAQFPESLRSNPAAMEAMLADTLGAALASRLGISILPNNIGQGIGGIMSMRLENGDDIKLKVGQGDYVFDVRLNKFAKIKTAENSVGTAFVFGTYMTMNFLEPELGTAFIATDLKNGESAILPAGQVNSNDFAAYQEAIQGLFTKFTDALQQPGSKWIDTAASVKPIEPQMAAAREILRTCK
ncbi:MAG: hypothetical protein ACXWC4_03605 [Telluria sp.]